MYFLTESGCDDKVMITDSWRMEGSNPIKIKHKAQEFLSDGDDIVQLDGETGEHLEESVNVAANTLEKYKSVLTNLLGDKYDKFEVMSLARKFDINLESESSFSQQKYILQKHVLENILKEDESDRYSQLLKETNQLCSFKSPPGYSCCLIGCTFRADRHRNYVKHVQQVHSTYHKFSCQFGHKCTREFSSIIMLIDHIKESHCRGPAVRGAAGGNVTGSHSHSIDVACKCDMQVCQGKKFANLKLFMSHFNSFHHNDPRQCIFEDCGHSFNANSTSRHHFRTNHLLKKKLKLKRKHLVNAPTEEILGGSEDCLNIDHDEEDVFADDAEDYEDGDIQFLELEGVTSDTDAEDQSDYFLKAYADFQNRMCHFKFIPHKTMEIISSEYLAQSLKSMELRRRKLKESLKQIPSVTDEQIEEIVAKVLDDDPMINAQRELDTVYKRNKFIRDNFKYVAPQEIVLNETEVKNGVPKDVLHYIPVIETFKHILEDKTMIKVLEKAREERNSKEGVIRDIKDGRMYKRLDFFKNNPDALVAIFYSDALELVNPLGSARGKHKVVQVFWTLADIPKEQRSKIDRLNLALVVKEKHIKKYGYSLIYKNMLNDLKKLEEGIMVESPVPRLTKCGVLVHAGDNLESHSVGGFSTCFSSKDVCRFCHCQYKDLPLNIHDYDGDVEHKYWNVQEYDEICDGLEEDGEIDSTSESLPAVTVAEFEDHLFDEFEEPSENSDSEIDSDESIDESDEEEEENETKKTYGLKHRCPFNVLQSFHAVYAFPPDLLHDLHEGVIAQGRVKSRHFRQFYLNLNPFFHFYKLRFFNVFFNFLSGQILDATLTLDLCGIIKILSSMGWFTIEEYNEALQKQRFKSYEMNDRPQQIVNTKAVKLSGKAVSIWLHMRCFGMVIHNFAIDYDDDVLSLGLQLSEITERLSANEFREHEIDYLEDKILTYLDDRKKIFDNFPTLLGKAKPKHHNMTHYPDAIRNLGPAMSFWTGRFEAKHRVAKGTAESAKNFINISATLAIRQQMRMASVFYGGFFDTADFHLPDKVTKKNHISNETEFNNLLREFMAPSDVISDQIILKSQEYKTGDIIVIRAIGKDELKVGVIQTILVKINKVSFVSKTFDAARNKLNYFVTTSADPSPSFINPLHMADYKPLIRYGTDAKFKFYLHHHISFSHD